jgi:nuclear transport factor 2 (NTF2) superfamily protein
LQELVNGSTAASPFTTGTAAQKARMAEDAWNTPRSGARRARLYGRQPLAQSRRVLQGPRAIEAFLTRKWNRELDYG